MKSNKFIILSLITVLVLSLFVGCRKIGDTASSLSNNSDVSSTVYDIVDVVDDDNQSTSSINSSEDTESETTDTSSDTGSSSLPNNFVDVGNGDSDDEDIPPVYIEPTPDTTVSGDSSSSDTTIPTYIAALNSKGKAKTREIDPGKYHYYKIRGASNQILTIESPNAYVVYNDVTYSAKNGVLSFWVESDELASAQILFEIGNKGSQKESFTIQFSSPVGSKDNPEPINIVGKKITTTTKEGNEQGYSYSYVATKAGKLRFYILSDTQKGKLETTKSMGKNIIAFGTTDLIEETTYLITNKDSVGTYIEYKDVAVGDVITVTIGPNSGTSFPSVTVEWMIEYK